MWNADHGIRNSHLRHGLLSPLLALALVAPVAHATDWPTYAGNYARSGVSPDPLPASPAEAWVWTSPQPPQPAWQGEAKWDGYNKVFDLKPRQIFDRAFHAVVAQGCVYFGSSADDKVYCLDAKTGRELWSFYTEGPVRLAPTIADGRAFFGSDDGSVYCLDAATGQPVWQALVAPKDRRIPGNGRVISNWPVRTSVVVVNGTVYTTAGMFPSEGVHLVAFDATIGRELWRQVQTDLPAQGYLLASKSRLYVPAGRNNPVVCELATGKRQRVVDGGGGTYALLTDDMLVFGPGKSGQLGAVEGGQSDQLASFQGTHMIVTPTRSYLQSDIELSALDRARYLDLVRQRKALAKRQADVVKEIRNLGEKPENAARRDGLKAELTGIGTQVDELTAGMEDCLAWKIPCRWPLSLLLAGETVVAGGEDEVAGFNIADGKVAWTLPVKGKAYGLAAADGALLVSTDAGTIHCFRGPAHRAALENKEARR
jgi:outer membrane protein assembly factor BamB